MQGLELLQDKQILVLGAGLSGLSCAHFLQRHGIDFCLNDSRANIIDGASFTDKFPHGQLALGQWQQDWLANADIVLISPGIDLATPELALTSDDCQIWGDVELYCRLAARQQQPMPKIIAVTGSNGKSTVVTLLEFWARRLGLNAQLGGNIGTPVLDNIEQLPEYLILELSSFQLESLNSMAATSASVLNVSDDHLDRHGDMAHYQAVKQGIYDNAQYAVINRDDPATWLSDEQAKQLETEKFSFGIDKPATGQFGLSQHNLSQYSSELYLYYGEQALIAVKQLPIAGIHNALNCLAALALATSAGWPLAELVKLLPEFQGLPHRCQPVASDDGILWVNDSKATNVGATQAALSGLAPQQSNQYLYLIAGGVGKGADFSPLTQLIEQHVTRVFTFGQDGEQIATLTDKATEVDSLEQAVGLAAKYAKTGDIVLLSPACASLDMFSNFAARGQAFIDAVQQLQDANLGEV